MKLIIASNNNHKLIEIKAILGGLFEEILSMREAGIEHETIEDGSSFMENAVKKAKEIAELSGCCALADDSGICVDALDGAPGVYSARYAGENANDKANNEKLLEALKGEPNREAKFVCTVACVFPDGSEPIVVEGETEGEILCVPRGESGFGYDPLFWFDFDGKTFAEMSEDEKNAVSHRGKAIKKLAAALAQRLGNENNSTENK